MQTRYIGRRSLYLRPVCRGGYYNKGEGIRMALAIGAAPCGDYGSYHAEPIDPRSGMAEPSVFIFSYGILSTAKAGASSTRRPATIDACYERITRQIYDQTEGIAYAMLDARHHPHSELQARPAHRPAADRRGTSAELAAKLGIARGRRLTRPSPNTTAAAAGAHFKPLALDGARDADVTPPKSNWAHPLTSRRSSVSGDLVNVLHLRRAESRRARAVLNQQGDPIPGLYAAGEVVGHVLQKLHRRDLGAERRGVRPPAQAPMPRS